MMKAPSLSLIVLFWSLAAFFLNAQTHFNPEAYRQYVNDHRDMSTDALMSEFEPKNVYFKGNAADTSLSRFAYMDSAGKAYGLTPDELGLLMRNHFMVSERLSFDCFGQAFHDVYGKDLPVMLTTDAVLEALHASYDRILRDVEITALKPKLDSLLAALFESFPVLPAKYGGNALLADAVADVDLYVTAAKSLLEERKIDTRFCPQSKMDGIWNAVQSEQFTAMPLFSGRNRNLDFSQFKVRGHYALESWDPVSQSRKKVLAPYFKSMMWLGRIDFLLTPPWDVPPWTREEIRRMNLGAVMLNELIDAAGARSTLNSMDRIIRMMVGESDNLTPDGLSGIVKRQNIEGADKLLDDAAYDAFQYGLKSSGIGGQRILTDCFLMNPFSSTPDTLPVSFRLMGQRFVVDSYIFSNLVYDRIVYHDVKIWRPMPDPLDAAFVLGCDNALPLLKGQMDEYHYACQAASLRYLVDSFDESFWDASLYNSWLNAIRLLNPPGDLSNRPFFMRTAAWQQEKLNTQLASWSQLRHDNLLYAKQSYTGMTMCSYPHSFIEPYPEFFDQIARFSRNAKTAFADLPALDYGGARRVDEYFSGVETLALKLQSLARKELDRVPFSAEERDFLGRMLFKEGGSGKPPFSGWFSDLYYDPFGAADLDYIVADVHTQPTDEWGAVVGRVLHVGVGRVNLGVFIADSPSMDFTPMAFVGPVMSYYEKITDNFDRLTDERWADMVKSSGLPDRPDWVNIYLADGKGNAYPKGRELNGIPYTGVEDHSAEVPGRFALFQNYPNPFNPSTKIVYALGKPGFVKLDVYDVGGRLVKTLAEGPQNAGRHVVEWNSAGLSSGVYFCRLDAESQVRTIKMLLLR